jgi:hypothetical protein
MDTAAIKKAILAGWKPIMENGKTDYRLKSAKVSWIPHLERCIVRTDRGALLLDNNDLESAKYYNLRSEVYAEERRSHNRSGEYEDTLTFDRSIQGTDVEETRKY